LINFPESIMPKYQRPGRQLSLYTDANTLDQVRALAQIGGVSANVILNAAVREFVSRATGKAA
jgi:hypothetical protein